jgi:hypothetical protein
MTRAYDTAVLIAASANIAGMAMTLAHTAETRVAEEA